jgi:hypothetical protein
MKTFVILPILSPQFLFADGWTTHPVIVKHQLVLISNASPRTFGRLEKLHSSNTFDTIPSISISIPYDESLAQTNTPTDSYSIDANSTSYLIHKGRAIDMIKKCVSIEGLSISKGWMPQATEAFKLAVEAVVRKNPILTGKLVEVQTSPWPWGRKELRIVPNSFSPESHSYCKVLAPPVGVASILQSKEDNAKELFSFVHTDVAPLILEKPDFSFEQIKNGSPLFESECSLCSDTVCKFDCSISRQCHSLYFNS